MCGLRQLRRMFSILASIFGVYILTGLTERITGFGISAVTSVLLISGMLLLLISIHIHYMMVRSPYIPLSVLRPSRAEYYGLVHDILVHDEFLRLDDFFHHSGSIYDHVKRVSYMAYSISKVLSLDYLSAARGGLLHDFFLYDWRKRKEQDASRRLHGREHPYIALENAEEHFSVNERERDIITKHMFPKTLPPPRYIESVIVSLSDKIAAMIEYLVCLWLHMTGGRQGC